mmetsp:Transcript_55206/g.145274  ORF Transcript_55206/g.145274 Transcript_55206/m.145274 type:complete len:532 (+) Transcript_55206:1179-2774(+)
MRPDAVPFAATGRDSAPRGQMRCPSCGRDVPSLCPGLPGRPHQLEREPDLLQRAGGDDNVRARRGVQRHEDRHPAHHAAGGVLLPRAQPRDVPRAQGRRARAGHHAPLRQQRRQPFGLFHRVRGLRHRRRQTPLQRPGGPAGRGVPGQVLVLPHVQGPARARRRRRDSQQLAGAVPLHRARHGADRHERRGLRRLPARRRGPLHRDAAAEHAGRHDQADVQLQRQVRDPGETRHPRRDHGPPRLRLLGLVLLHAQHPDRLHLLEVHRLPEHRDVGHSEERAARLGHHREPGGQQPAQDAGLQLLACCHLPRWRLAVRELLPDAQLRDHRHARHLQGQQPAGRVSLGLLHILAGAHCQLRDPLHRADPPAQRGLSDLLYWNEPPRLREDADVLLGERERPCDAEVGQHDARAGGVVHPRRHGLQPRRQAVGRLKLLGRLPQGRQPGHVRRQPEHRGSHPAQHADSLPRPRLDHRGAAGVGHGARPAARPAQHPCGHCKPRPDPCSGGHHVQRGPQRGEGHSGAAAAQDGQPD